MSRTFGTHAWILERRVEEQWERMAMAPTQAILLVAMDAIMPCYVGAAFRIRRRALLIPHDPLGGVADD